MERNSEVRCKNCCYYDVYGYLKLGELLGAKEEDGRGLCRRFGPVAASSPLYYILNTRVGWKKWFKWFYLATLSAKGTTVWPSVRADSDWCGEFKNTLCEEENPYFLDPTQD